MDRCENHFRDAVICIWNYQPTTVTSLVVYHFASLTSLNYCKLVKPQKSHTYLQRLRYILIKNVIKLLYPVYQLTSSRSCPRWAACRPVWPWRRPTASPSRPRSARWPLAARPARGEGRSRAWSVPRLAACLRVWWVQYMRRVITLESGW